MLGNSAYIMLTGMMSHPQEWCHASCKLNVPWSTLLKYYLKIHQQYQDLYFDQFSVPQID